jgi:hypothetical protein
MNHGARMGNLRFTSLSALLLASCAHITDAFSQKDFETLSSEVCQATMLNDKKFETAQGNFGAGTLMLPVGKSTGISYTLSNIEKKEVISIVDQDCNGGLNIAYRCELKKGQCQMYEDREALLPLYSALIVKMHAALQAEPFTLDDLSSAYEQAWKAKTSTPFEGPLTLTYGPYEILRAPEDDGTGTITSRTYIVKGDQRMLLFKDDVQFGELDVARACKIVQNVPVCSDVDTEKAVSAFVHVNAALERRPYQEEFKEIFEELTEPKK